MKYTREAVLDAVKRNDTGYFSHIYNEGMYTEDSNAKEVYYISYGDGNEMEEVLKFSFKDSEPIFVLMVGFYSSWDSSTFNSVSLAEPYEFKEIRYRAILEPITEKNTSQNVDWSLPRI
jgi:hypothetical protein